MRKIFTAVLLLALCAGAQGHRTVEDLISYIKTAIAEHYKDADVAATIQNIRLASRLDEKTVAELQRLGAQPRTVAALHKLAAASASLPETAAPAVKTEPALPSPPSPADFKQIVSEIRDNALNYTQSLPNYLCTQITKRHVDTGTGSFRDADVILEQLSFFDQKENYTVKMVNNSMVTNNSTQHDKLGGATSSGEFGSILRAIFSPESETQFLWQRWTGLNHHAVYVVAFQTEQPMYTITHDGSKRTIHTRTHGLIFADRDTKMVMRLHMECDGIPPDFPIQSVTLDQDYDFQDIGGHDYVLPLHSDIRSREGNYRAWNEVTFRSYHKYGTESTITFDTGDQPSDKLKEEKPKK
jgi:Aromatic acid exporter family member 2